MRFGYLHYKRFYLIALLWVVISVLFKYKELFTLNQSYKWHVLVFLIIQLLVIPICFVLLGLYLKNISISTESSGIIFSSFFKKISSSWNEIIIVERYGPRVKVKTLSGTFTYHPMIGMDSKEIRNADNVFKRCNLLQEIHSKAIKAEFNNFPENTF